MDLVIVDCQNDFISGSMACENSENAVDNICKFLNDNEDLNVYYTADFHPANHMSFKKEGGIWPPHCVEGTWGSEIHSKLKNSSHAPDDKNTFLKGRCAELEEYSGFEGKNSENKALKDALKEDTVYIAGIASEYCVRETALQLKKFGKNIVILKDMLGYVNKEEHLKNLEDLKSSGIEIR